MDMYEDYGKYLDDNSELINKLHFTDSKILICLNDCIKVLDYLYRQHLDHKKLDPDQEEVFDIGYGYLSNIVSDLAVYYKDYFHNSIEEMNKYADLIIYNILLEDLKGYLDGEEILDDARKKQIDDGLTLIDEAMLHKTPVTKELTGKIEADLEESMSTNPDYKPAYIVFSMMAEELDLI